MTTTEMEFAISRRFDVRTHLMVPNISWGLFSHEADMLVVRESGYCLEFEIKRSFADYKADFKKRKWKNGSSNRIKEFYYTFPAELWHKRENDIRTLLPDFAGVLVIYNGEGFPTSKIARDAKPNSKSIPLSKSQMYDVARLGTMRIWNLKSQIITLKSRK